ncbi:ANTAR domain-containing response regulator [Vallitalea okinawensis]|uniref:ANTAR domain-containing response regulator n=1 Tax=Vallitalea okinawensis TaxID=2078660 RepID=UPI000CFADBCF|nr:response regulator [Vallitalea okinawensis]
MGINIIIGSANETVIKKLKAFFKENGYNVVGSAMDGYELLRQVHMYHPDVCVCDFSMKGLNGHEVSQVLISDRKTAVIAIGSPSENQHYSDIKSDPYFSLVSKPLNRYVLLTSIQILYKSVRVIKKMEKEIKALKKEMKDRDKIVNAKFILMQHKGMSEEEAHKHLLNQSMKEGISKSDAAQLIINFYGEDDF